MICLWFAVVTVVISSIFSEPIIRGIDVGHVARGKVVDGDEFPFLVYMEIDYMDADNVPDGFSCGGVLIKPKVVLTAAHCLAVCNVITGIFVWAGVSKFQIQLESGQTNFGKYYRIHKDFGGRGDETDSNFLHNDIGLIWLQKSFTIKDGVKLAKLPEHPILSYGEQGWAAGWGETEFQGTSSELKKVLVETISKNECIQFYPPKHFNGKNFCAKSIVTNSGVAPGDSGGPLVVNGKVIGIISYGCTFFATFPDGRETRQCDTRFPSAYTYVYKFNDWINWNVRDVAKKSFIAATRKFAKDFKGFCKRKGFFKRLKRGILKRNREWRDSTENIPPPTLI